MYIQAWWTLMKKARKQENLICSSAWSNILHCQLGILLFEFHLGEEKVKYISQREKHITKHYISIPGHWCIHFLGSHPGSLLLWRRNELGEWLEAYLLSLQSAYLKHHGPIEVNGGCTICHRISCLVSLSIVLFFSKQGKTLFIQASWKLFLPCGSFW